MMPLRETFTSAEQQLQRGSDMPRCIIDVSARQQPLNASNAPRKVAPNSQPNLFTARPAT